MNFITMKMMEQWLDTNEYNFQNKKNISNSPVAKKVKKFTKLITEDEYYKHQFNYRFLRKLFIYASPVMLELSYWVNKYYNQFSTFLLGYMGKTYDYYRLPQMLQNNDNFSFDGNVLVNDYLKYYNFYKINLINPKSLPPGTFEMFTYKEKGKENEEVVTEEEYLLRYDDDELEEEDKTKTSDDSKFRRMII